MSYIETVKLPDGSSMPRLGQGTWQMAEDDHKMEREIAALVHGIRAGYQMIDTAEMYADGRAEMYAGKAIKAAGIKREDIYIVDKVCPENANESRIFTSVDRSLTLLGTDYIDLYLLHWRGESDLVEMSDLMNELVVKGKIRRWGVSNFSITDMEDLWKCPGGRDCVTNQILYNLGSRGPEFDLIPWMLERKMPYMAYCPIGQAGALITQDGVDKQAMVTDPRVVELARKKQVTVVQLLLAFVLKDPNCATMTKAVGINHVDENYAARNIELTEEEIQFLSESFPSPTQASFFEKY